ncbi:hypothetical protein [Streptomyces sp. NPDC001948]
MYVIRRTRRSDLTAGHRLWAARSAWARGRGADLHILLSAYT